jgi:DNA-binding transcriptional LysR family regulator
MQKILDSKQINAFATLARVGSFTLAAKELGLTQSAVSHAMKALETDISCRLCDRSGRHVSLTQAGEQFLRHAERILTEMDAARLGIDALNNWGQTRLRIGASASACQYILPTVLSEFKKRYPRCSLSIEPGDYDRQMDLLERGQIDVAFMLEPGTNRGLEFVPLFTDELLFLVSPSHYWAVLGRVPKESISSETVILYSKTSRTYKQVNDYFSENGISLSRQIELGSMDAIKELVKLGMGAGVLSSWVAKTELSQGLLRSFPLGPRPLKRIWGIAYAGSKRLSLPEETFVSLCREQTVHQGLATLASSAA